MNYKSIPTNRVESEPLEKGTGFTQVPKWIIRNKDLSNADLGAYVRMLGLYPDFRFTIAGFTKQYEGCGGTEPSVKRLRKMDLIKYTPIKNKQGKTDGNAVTIYTNETKWKNRNNKN